MMSSLLNLAKVDCPHCRAANAIVASVLALDSRIACSRCHGEIGRWRDLIGNDKTGGNARQA